jgi:phage-related holin
MIMQRTKATINEVIKHLLGSAVSVPVVWTKLGLNVNNEIKDTLNKIKNSKIAPPTDAEIA